MKNKTYNTVFVKDNGVFIKLVDATIDFFVNTMTLLFVYKQVADVACEF